MQQTVRNRCVSYILEVVLRNFSFLTELRLAQLALDPNNSPAWEVPEQERRPSTKMPLFVRAQCVYKSQHQTEVRDLCRLNAKVCMLSLLLLSCCPFFLSFLILVG
jgi:Rho guanine nucleotide exchange factor 10